MIHDWRKFLSDHVSEWEVSGSGEWQFLFHNNYHPHYSNINVLWFQGKTDYPSVVTKFHREPDILRREFENLKYAHGSAPAWVPRPLHFGQLGSFWSLWMQGLPGKRHAAQTKHAPATLRSMTDMVASLHGEVAKTAAEPAPDRYSRLITAPLASVVSFGDSPNIKEGCARLSAAFPDTWSSATPVIPQHGDLFCDNLLRHRGRWHVIDWESFGTIDLPFYDLLTLLLSLAGAMDKAPEAWDATLVEQIPELVQRYAGTLGLQSADICQALPLTLINWFHLQWRDGRQEFSKRMYNILDGYFRSPGTWERVFFVR